MITAKRAKKERKAEAKKDQNGAIKKDIDLIFICIVQIRILKNCITNFHCKNFVLKIVQIRLKYLSFRIIVIKKLAYELNCIHFSRRKLCSFVIVLYAQENKGMLNISLQQKSGSFHRMSCTLEQLLTHGQL